LLKSKEKMDNAPSSIIGDGVFYPPKLNKAMYKRKVNLWKQ